MADRTIPVLNAAGVPTVQAAESAAVDSLVKRDSDGNAVPGNIGTFNTGLILSGFLKGKVQTKTSSFSIDEVLAATTNGVAFVCDTTSGSITVSLPAASTSTNRFLLFIKTVAANNLVLDGNASETINGATTKTTATQYGFALIFTDGSNWHALLSGTWT